MRTKEQILAELVAMTNRLENIQDECKWHWKGYSDGAAELAAQAVFHLIDLVSVADPVPRKVTSEFIGGVLHMKVSAPMDEPKQEEPEC